MTNENVQECRPSVDVERRFNSWTGGKTREPSWRGGFREGGGAENLSDWFSLCPSFSESCRVSYSEHPAGFILWSSPKGPVAEQTQDPCGLQGVFSWVWLAQSFFFLVNEEVLVLLSMAAKTRVIHSFLVSTRRTVLCRTCGWWVASASLRLSLPLHSLSVCSVLVKAGTR